MAETSQSKTGLSEEEILEGLSQAFEKIKIYKSVSTKVKEVFKKSESPNLKVLVIPEDLHNEIEKARLEARPR